MSPKAGSDHGLPPSAGTKVTKDPESKKPVPEAPGVITSDSLAAESKEHGGAFGANNPKAVPMKQPSHGTTTNTTDTSGATTLPPSSERREQNARTDEKFEPASEGANAGKAEGRGPTYAATTGSSGGSRASHDTRGAAKVSPSEAARNIPTGKTEGIGEAEFEGDEPNASFTSEIGTENDPAWLAERKFELLNARSGVDAGYPRQKPAVIKDDTPYKVLSETSA